MYPDCSLLYPNSTTVKHILGSSLLRARVINSALQAHSMGSLPGEPKYGYILKLGIFNDILIIIFMYRIVVHEV